MSATLQSGRCKNDDPIGAATYLVSVAGSAGAFPVLRDVLSRLALESAAMVAMLHSPSDALADVLEASSAVQVRRARSGDVLAPSCVYVAPGKHVIVNPDARVTVSPAPRVDLFRPSANWLFESAAASYRDRHLAIVLGGTMWDGAASLRYVKGQGGLVWAQAPDDCRFGEMPAAAIRTGYVDEVLKAADIPRALRALLRHRDRDADRSSWEQPFRAPAARPRSPRPGRSRAQ